MTDCAHRIAPDKDIAGIFGGLVVEPVSDIRLVHFTQGHISSLFAP